MEYEQIAFDIADGIATITLDRPEKLNAFTSRMLSELLDAFDRTDSDDGVRAVVVTGRGRGFCAGADLSGGGSTFDRTQVGPTRSAEQVAARDIRDGGGRLTLRIFDSLKPVIAAINGPAVGVGVTMTLPMDVRLASTQARIGFVFAKRGLVPEACSSWFLPRIVGVSRAAEWVYSARVFPAAEALEARLVRSVHEPDELLPAAYSLAREFATNTSAISVSLSRRMLWRMLTLPHPMDAHKADSRGIDVLGRADDAREGVASFLEKRDPSFPMKVSKDLPDIFPFWSEPAFE